MGEDKSALEAVVAADQELVSLRDEEKRLQVGFEASYSFQDPAKTMERRKTGLGLQQKS